MTGNRRPGGIPAALLYTRVSSHEQAREGLSLPAQLADVRRYAAEQGWAIASEYQDVLTGKRDDRPGYQALLAEARRLRAEGKPAVVVVSWLHRFGRRVLERVRAREELKGLGVPTHSTHEGGEVSDLVANILASVAEEESRQLGERVAEVRSQIVAAGWLFPGRASFGYRWRPRTEEEKAQLAPKLVLEVDPDRSPYFREAARRARAGASVRSIARWLHSLPEGIRAGLRFSNRTVGQMLKSPTYIARPEAGDEHVLSRPVGRWPALLDDASWAEIQRQIASHSRLPKQATGRYLLTGFLRCPLCGSRMRGSAPPHGSRGQHYPRYQCAGEQLGCAAPDPSCQYTCTTRRVDAAVLAEVGRILEAVVPTDPDLQAALERAWRRLTQPAIDPSTAPRRRDLERMADQARGRLKKAARLFVDGSLDKQGYELERDASQHDLDGADAELAELSSDQPVENLPPLGEVLELVGSWAPMLLSAEVPNQREVLGLLVETAVPHRLRQARYEVQIAWTPLGRALRALAARDAC